MTPNESLQTGNISSSSSVELHDRGSGIFSIRMSCTEGGNTLSRDLIAQLMKAIDTVRNSASVKVLILEGTRSGFARGGRAHYNDALVLGLYQAVASFPYPVIAAMHGDAVGSGFLLGALCDFMVCNEAANYRYTCLEEGLVPTAEEDRLFSKRFGQVRAADFLYWSTMASGKQLKEKQWSCPILPAEEVEECVLTLATSLARKSQDSLRLLKQHLARHMLDLTKALTAVEPAPGEVRNGAKKGIKGGAKITAPGKHIQLETHADKVLVLKIRNTKKKYQAKALAADLTALFTQLKDRPAYRAIVLLSEYPDFLPEAETTLPVDAVSSMQRALLQAPLPVVAVMSPSVAGKAWLVGQFCDLAVYLREGSHSAAGLLQSPDLAGLAAYMFSHRFGNEAARNILLTGVPCTGAELQQRFGPVPLASYDQALSVALKLAESWAAWPSAAISAWKRRTVLGIQEQIDHLPADPVFQTGVGATSILAPAPIALASKVIAATAYPEGIVEVTMQDRESKNMFSEAFIQGMNEVFAHIDATPDYKVVILVGYDKYFASGGTKEALVAIQQGKLKFTEDRTFQLALTCKIPVIAAMQGHAIGAGLSLGLFADLPLLSEESKYMSPYMSYGFTPGVGATLIVPERMGQDLARDTLLTAREYDGAELKDRGLPLPVYPRKQLREAAMQLAKCIAQQSRDSLILVKRHLTRHIRDGLAETCEREVSMHELTFVGQSETLKQIETVFHQRENKHDHVAPTAGAANAVAWPEIVDALKQLLAGELHLEGDDLDENTQFTDLGLDSITGVTWIRKVNEKYGLSLDATIVYSHPTLTKLGRHVKEVTENRDSSVGMPDFAELETRKLGYKEPERQSLTVPSISLAQVAEPYDVTLKEKSDEVSDEPPPVRELVSWRKTLPKEPAGAGTISSADTSSGKPSAPGYSPQPIAVIGMAGQFPMAKNLDEYWRNIAEGRNCISEVPSNRWDLDAYFQEGEPVEGKTNSKWLGLLEEYDLFDPLFFNISPAEAKAMDPQQRLFLQTCWQSIEHAGYNPKSLAGSQCGVFVGGAGNDYGLLSRKVQLSAHGFTGNASSILSARISYFLDLQGPCLAIDTACSSSLVAIATACDSLVSGVSDLALAGGVYVGAGPAMHIMTSQSGMLSMDGRCYTFDHRANGFVPGEAVGVVMLKRLADAERDGDIIHAVVQGWGINQDGRTNGITAPNPESQARLMQDVYRRYGIDPAEIQLIEAHGTGTALGDPIEIEGLKKSFRATTRNKDYCALGSVKSNIGHCLTAAGMTAFIKAVLALKHKKLPPTINFERLNQHINLKDSPFYVNDHLQDWELKGASRRQAAVSSFGYSGTNAHVVVAEYAAPQRTTPSVSLTKFLIPLSAKTAEQLKQRARDLLDFIHREGSSTDLAEITYTLQVGREAMDERLGLVVGSMEQLVEKLQAYVDGQQDIADAFHGQVRLNKEGISLISQDEELKETIIDNWIAQKKFSKLLKLWAKGLELDWNKLYGEVKPQRIVLPTYPFAKERYWIDNPDGGRFDASTSAAIESSKQLFFEEYWKEQPFVITGTKSGGSRSAGNRKTVVFADPEAAAMETGKLPSDAVVIVDQSIDIQSVIRRVANESGLPVSVICTWAKGRKEVGIHALFDLFKAIKACGTLVSDVLLAGRYDSSHLDSVWDYSWIGFERSLKLVLPEVKVSLLYTDTPACTAEQLMEAQQSGGVSWYQSGKRYVPAFKPVEVGRAPQSPMIKQHGAYLITGGCGALGMKFARYLAQNYHARLVLLGRRPLSADIQEQLDGLRRAGAGEVHYAAVDIGNGDELKAWVQTLSLLLSGVFHAAGVEVARPFHEKSTADFDAVLRPKTTGTVLLDEALQGHPLDFVCYFSSSAGVLGDFGSCDYAIANRFQMAYGQYRRQHGKFPGKTVVINWPFWQKEAGQKGGMGSNDPEQVAFYLKSSGQDALGSAEGIRIWEELLHADRAQTLVMIGQPTRIEQFLSRIYLATQPTPAAPVPATLSIPHAFSASAPAKDLPLHERLRFALRQLISSSLQIDQSRLDDRTNLADYGFDSISLASFAKRLTSHFSLEVTPALFFNYSTVQQLVDYFATEHQRHFQEFYGRSQAGGAEANGTTAIAVATPGGQIAAPVHNPPALRQLPLREPPFRERFLPTVSSASTRQLQGTGSQRESIAIIGMSGRFPQANDVDQLWTLLAEGRSGITEIPRSRWDWRDYFTAPGHIGNVISTNKGGFIDNVDEFDPLFFEISPAEAEEMDPSERILLMEAYRAIEDARISPASLRGSNVGVFVGMEESQYSLVTDVQGVTTTGAAMISSRLSYFLDLHGPTIATNTACSSGLVALHQAVASLRQGECESALVAGVALNLSPKAWIKMSEARMLSKDGQCYSFSKNANGIGVGEAIVVLMLKPLSAAMADRDRIYGVIKASGINFDGKTNGVTAPNGRAQAKLIESVYTDHGIDIRDVSHIVAHGTGTKLGDPVEINALNDAFKKLSRQQDIDVPGVDTPSRAHCAITSCKTNFGHTMAASGLVSLVGLLKGMEHRKIPASLYCEEENDYINWRNSHFYVNKSTRDWQTDGDKLRMGAVSAFGRSGTNAHVVVEEYRAPAAIERSATAANGNATVIIPLSARATPQLQQKARDLLDFIRRQGQADLASIAYTLQVAREPMETRLALVANSIEQLAQGLDAYLSGRPHANVFQGTAGHKNEGMIAVDNFPKLAELWVEGLDLDWEKLYGDQPRPARVSLPTYPFARERYWINSPAPDDYSEREIESDARPGDGLESIEDIINKVDEGSLEKHQAAAFLKKMVM